MQEQGPARLWTCTSPAALAAPGLHSCSQYNLNFLHHTPMDYESLQKGLADGDQNLGSERGRGHKAGTCTASATRNE